MCGICGIAGRPARDALERMTAVIAHRGPDDSGIFLSDDGQIGLGNRRLAILDRSAAGHMPMRSDDGALAVTYNGEIYNYPELRRDITARGRAYRSHTDTEALLHLYDLDGPDFVRRLNGIFAFALWDGRRRRLLLARDRMGVKPLYYTVAGDVLLFASEIKSLLLAPGVRAEPDPEAIHCALTFGWTPAPLTGFRGIRKLPPGHLLLWQDGRFEERRYWDVPYASGPHPDDGDTRRAPAEWVAEFRAAFDLAITRQQLSDVPVGVFLSGGLDSSAIVASMATQGRPLRSYTIRYRPQDQALEQMPDETGYARLVAARFGSEHHVITAEPRMADLLPDLIRHMDEPLSDPAAISTYVICRAARPFVTVLLSGQGADELLAGYRTYGSHRLADSYARLPSPARGALAAAADVIPRLAGRVPGAPPGLVLAAHRYLSNLTTNGALPPGERHAAYHQFFTPAERARLLTPDFRRSLAGHDIYGYHRAYERRVVAAHPLNRHLYMDLKTFLPERNLLYADKMGMAASIEVRVPFLDNDLIDLAARMPASMKLRGFTTKYVLRESMRGVLPDVILRRRKGGFGAPIRAWLTGELRPMLDEVLAPEAVRRRGLFRPEAVAAIRRRAATGYGQSATQLWNLLTIELWHRVFIDTSPRLESSACRKATA